MSLLSARLVDGAREFLIDPREDIDVTQFDLGHPQSRTVEESRPQGDGSLDTTQFHGSRPVTLRLDLWGTDGPNLVDELGYFTHPGRRPWLIYQLDGQVMRRVLLRADQQSAPLTADRLNVIAAQLSWVAPRGIQESDRLHQRIANPAEAVGGRTYPLTFDRSYPLSKGAGVVEITNAGNTSADALLRIYGPCTDPRIEAIDAAGEVYRLEFTAAGGLTVADRDYVEVDLAERSATLNGDPDASLLKHLAYADPARSSWWRLSPGDNLVRFYPVTASAPSGLHIFWRDSWI